MTEEKKRQNSVIPNSHELDESFFKTQFSPSKNIRLEIIPKDSRKYKESSKYWTPIYPAHYEGRVIYRNIPIKTAESVNTILTGESAGIKEKIRELVDLAADKATIITRHEQSKFTVEHSSAATFLFVTVLVAARELINAFVNENGVLINDKTVAFIVFIINAAGFYYERTRKSAMQSRKKDLQIICDRIDDDLLQFETGLPPQPVALPPSSPRIEIPAADTLHPISGSRTPTPHASPRQSEHARLPSGADLVRVSGMGVGLSSSTHDHTKVPTKGASASDTTTEAASVSLSRH